MQDLTFSGNIYIFHAFDIGEEIPLGRIQKMSPLTIIPRTLPKYFKNYHAPLSIELPHPHANSRCIGGKIHHFGAMSLTYKIPFNNTFKHIRGLVNQFSEEYLEQSVNDAKSIFKRIKKLITNPTFFHTRASHLVIQIDPQPDIDIKQLKEQYSSIIASMLRFETETLSEHQKNEILQSAVGYFRGDFIVIDVDASFVYDAEYEEILDLFEFANIQQLELRYFDRLLDKKLNAMYEEEAHKLPWRVYLPFIGTTFNDPVTQLGKLKVDISVITEQLESSIKFAGEPYVSELYDLLVENLDLKNWRNSIDRKLSIIQDIQTIYQHKVDINREDFLNLLIIGLIFTELVVGLLHYLK